MLARALGAPLDDMLYAQEMANTNGHPRWEDEPAEVRVWGHTWRATWRALPPRVTLTAGTGRPCAHIAVAMETL